MATNKSHLDNKIYTLIRRGVSEGLSKFTSNVDILKAMEKTMEGSVKAAWLTIVRDVQGYENELLRMHQEELNKKTNVNYEAMEKEHRHFLHKLCQYFDVKLDATDRPNYEVILNKIKANVTDEFDRVSSRNTASRTDAVFGVKNIRPWDRRWPSKSALVNNDDFRYSLMMQECVELRYELQRVMQKYNVPHDPKSVIKTTTMRILDHIWSMNDPKIQLSQEEYDIQSMRFKLHEIHDLRARIEQIEHLYNPPHDPNRNIKHTVSDIEEDPKSLESVITSWLLELAKHQKHPTMSKEEILSKISGIFSNPKK